MVVVAAVSAAKTGPACVLAVAVSLCDARIRKSVAAAVSPAKKNCSSVGVRRSGLSL